MPVFVFENGRFYSSEDNLLFTVDLNYSPINKGALLAEKYFRSSNGIELFHLVITSNKYCYE